MIEALERTVDREQWRLFCDAWWEIGVAYTLTLNGDWMIRVLAARMGADSAERQKVDQVLDKIGDFHRRLWAIETEVVRKAVDIAASGGRVLIVDERLAVDLCTNDEPTVIFVLWEELRRRSIEPECVYSTRIVMKRRGMIDVTKSEHDYTGSDFVVLRIPLTPS